MAQRSFERRKVKVIAGPLNLIGRNTLATGDKHGFLAEYQLQEKSRNRNRPDRTVQYLPDRGYQLSVGDRRRRNSIIGTPKLVMVHREAEHADQIVEVDPGDVLLS